MLSCAVENIYAGDLPQWFHVFFASRSCFKHKYIYIHTHTYTYTYTYAYTYIHIHIHTHTHTHVHVHIHVHVVVGGCVWVCGGAYVCVLCVLRGVFVLVFVSLCW